MSFLQRKEFDTICNLFRVQCLCGDFKVLYYLTNVSLAVHGVSGG